MARIARPSTSHRRRTLGEIAGILAARPDLEDALHAVLTPLLAAFPSAGAAAILLYDAALGCLHVAAALGYGLEESGKDLPLAPGEGVCRTAFQSGLGARRSGPSELAAALSAPAPGCDASALAAPLVAGQNRLGVILVEQLPARGGIRPDRLDDSDLAYLGLAAGIISLGIENSRLREQLQAERSLNEGSRLTAGLISTLAHEMRTPLTSIKGYSTAMLLEDASFPPKTQREFLQIIDEETDVLLDLIRDLLESSIIDAGLLTLEPQPLRLPRLAADLLADATRRNPQYRFLLDFPPDFPLVEADPRRIEQVLRNLLDNAVKYSAESSTIVVRGEVCGEEAVVSVADQGMGISPADLNHLFEKFFRVKAGLGRQVVGSGLGLPIARNIVESHGGRIWAESQLGHGSTFYFTLPLPAGRGSESEGTL